MTTTSEKSLEALARDLLDLARQEQRMIAAGRLEEAVASIEHRRKLLQSLDGGSVPEGPAKELLREAEVEGAKTLTLLSALREELAERIGAGRHAHRAISNYGSASRL